MPKKKQTPEQQKEAYENWRQSPEWLQIDSFIDKRNGIKPIELASKDINDHWESYLEELFKVVQIMKVPGRKAKAYE
jgi:hypothetical protein